MIAEQCRPSMSHVIARSACSTPNLVALGLWLAVGLILGNCWVAILGGCLYGLLVARHGTSPAFWQKLAELEAERARELPAETTLTDPALMLVVQAIRKGYDEIGRVLRETAEPLQQQLSVVGSSLREVRAQAARLIRDADDLSRYLLTAPAEATQTAIQRLNEEILRSAHEPAKLEYQRALSVRRDQLAAVAEVACEHDRIVAALQLIVGTIEAFPAWVYRMRVLESRANDNRVVETSDALMQLRNELTASQHLLEGLARTEGGDDKDNR